MGFSGGSSNVTKAHTHSSAIVQDGGALDFNNVTQAGLSAGDITYSDGNALQVLGIGSANDTLQVNAGATAPEWAAAAAGGGSRCFTPDASSYQGLGGGGQTITLIGVVINDGASDIIGRTLTDVTFYLLKGGSPTGTGYVYIYNAAGSLAATSSTTLDWSTLTTSFVAHTFNISHTVANGDRIVIGGGSFAPTISGAEVSVNADDTGSNTSFQAYVKYTGNAGSPAWSEYNSGASGVKWCYTFS